MLCEDNLIPAAEFPAIPESAAKIASERRCAILQGRKKYTPPPWRHSFFFLFLGLRLYGVYPSFWTYGVYPFPLFSQENGIHHSFFCSVTLGSGDRPRKEGSRGGGVYSFFPCFGALRSETLRILTFSKESRPFFPGDKQHFESSLCVSP